jgi:hypothetical protein
MNWSLCNPSYDWGELRAQVHQVWEQSQFRSPFASPAFLECLAGIAVTRGRKNIVAVASENSGNITAIWPLCIDRARCLRLIQEIGCDHCGALYTKNTTVEDLATGLCHIVAISKPRSLYFDRIRPDDPSWEAVQIAMLRLGWFCKAFEATPNPCLVADSAHGIIDMRSAVLSHKGVNNYANRLKKQAGYLFENDETSEGLSDWVREFCAAHDWSWSKTDTPSMYRQAKARDELLMRLRGWCADGVLVRFSIRLAIGRAAFVIGLRARDRLIYYHTALNPGYNKFSAGHVLIREISKWMTERGICTLDFGVGDESYKIRYTNKIPRLLRIYAHEAPFSPTHCKGYIDQEIRKSEKLQALWNIWGNQRIRGYLFQRCRDLATRARIMVKVFGSSRSSVLVQDHMKNSQALVYFRYGRGISQENLIQKLDVLDVLDFINTERGLIDRERANFYEMRFKGALPFGIIKNGVVKHVSWLLAVEPESVSPGLLGGQGRVWRITKCYTAKHARGQDLFRQVLQAISDSLPLEDQIVTCAQRWNTAMQRDILCAGFLPINLPNSKGLDVPVKYRTQPVGDDEK